MTSDAPFTCNTLVIDYESTISYQLHFPFSQLHSDRDSIPDVPAIYFCAPTEENLGRIAQDFQNGLYDVYHLNFISPISRQKLEDLAAAALQSSCVANIHKVYDQYLNFITLEDDMFILKHQNSDAMSYYGKQVLCESYHLKAQQVSL